MSDKENDETGKNTEDKKSLDAENESKKDIVSFNFKENRFCPRCGSIIGISRKSCEICKADISAIEPMGEKDKKLKTLLLKAFNPNASIRKKAINDIGENKDVKVLGILTHALLNDPDEAVRKEAADELGDFKNSISVYALEKAAKDESENVKKEAIEGLKKIKEQSEKGAIKKSKSDIKKEKLEKRKKLVQAKKKKAQEKKKRKKFKKYLKLPEPKENMLRAVGGGLLGVLAQVALTYILWGIATDESILYLGYMIDFTTAGNPLNALAGIWALSFSPITTFGIIIKNWGEVWYYLFIPIIVAGVAVGTTGKRILTTIFGVLFFIFWGMVIPILMVFVFSIFGLFDPVLIDSFLLPILNEPMNAWAYGWIYDLSGNLFLSWTVAGTLEIGLFITIIALPIGALIQLIKY